MPRKVGSVEVAAKIDTSALERGILRMEMSLDRVKGKAASFSGDTTRMGLAATSAAVALGMLGKEAGQAFITMAGGAPAVAGAMSKIDIEMDKLQRTLGRGLSPVFDIAADAITNFTSFMSENEDTIYLLAKATETLYEDLKDLVDLVKDPIDILINISSPITKEKIEKYVAGEAPTIGERVVSAASDVPMVGMVIRLFNLMINDEDFKNTVLEMVGLN
jgi:hypothetical protein